MIINYTHWYNIYILRKPYENSYPIVVGSKRKKVQQNISKIKQFIFYVSICFLLLLFISFFCIVEM